MIINILGSDKMKRTPIYCEKCCREITDEDDLIIVNEKTNPYHSQCYKEVLREYKKRNIIYKLWHNITPINRIYGNVRLIFDLIFIAILCILSLVIKNSFYMLILTLLGLLLIAKRIFIWFQYERHMTKNKSAKPKVRLSKIIIPELGDMIKCYIYFLGISGISYLLVWIIYK